MSRPTKLILHEDALRHNLQRVRELAGHSKIISMVKANAYGHGLAQVAPILAASDYFGVSCIEEALTIRAAGVTNPIVLMEGVFAADELTIAEAEQLQLVIHDYRQLELLEQYQAKTPFSVWLKINTGMNRLGLPCDQVDAVITRLQKLTIVKQKINFMTHFAAADEINNDFTASQINLFQQTTHALSGEKSLANSAAIMEWPQSHANWVRPGIMLYGVSPFADKVGLDLNLQPAMTLQSEIIAIQHCKKGENVGYGSDWQCPEDMRVGIIAIGYGDGYPRHAKPGTPVLIGKKAVPLIGRVSMDMITVNLNSDNEINIGDSVTLWGQGLPIENIAESAGTIGYELLCGITTRVRRE